jgi:hypothetical protein
MLEESPTAPSEEVARKRAMAAYVNMWDDFVAAARTSDGKSPRLDDHATQYAVAELSRRLRADRANALVSKGDVDLLNPVVEPLYAKPTLADVVDCVDDLKLATYRADTGERVDDGTRGRHRVRAVVRLQGDSSWKVATLQIDEAGTC